jgi:PAT family beta-lactamase induction signal transducer AmpG
VVEVGFARAFNLFRRGFKSYLDQPKVWLVLSFIVLYKLGDEVLFSMVTPFLMRELKISTDQYAWIGGIVGAAGTIAGAVFGGWWINRVGLRRAIWPLTAIMNLNIWLYVWLSVALPDPTTGLGIFLIAAIHGVEQIAAGVGSSVLLVFLLSTCRTDYRATHYAIGSAIMSLPGTVIGGEGGRFVELFGYTALYLMAFVMALPGMCLIPFIPLGDGDRR